MKYLVTGKEMKLLDQNTSGHFKVPQEVLMEQAAMAFARQLLCIVPKMKKILIVCGLGNNGGDGIAVARLLNQQGFEATVFYAKDSVEKKGSELFEL